MNTTEAYENLNDWTERHASKWNSNLSPYKVLSCIDFSNDSFDTTDIDCTQVAADLSCWVIYEEKFYPHKEFENDYSLQVQKRQLKIADKAGVPAFLILTSRRFSNGIICGTPEKGIDWNKYIGTISTLYNSNDIQAAKRALGDGLADLYKEANVIAIIPNETAKEYKYKNIRIGYFLTHYSTDKRTAKVSDVNKLLKSEFSNL